MVISNVAGLTVAVGGDQCVAGLTVAVGGDQHIAGLTVVADQHFAGLTVAAVVLNFAGVILAVLHCG